MQSLIKKRIQQSIDIKNKLLNDNSIIKDIENISKIIINSYKTGGKVLICGNGGSAADAQHIAAELSGKFYFDREPLFAEALHVNSSYLTAVANDYSFSEVYSRMVKAKGNKGDILIGISTSGKSENIINAVKEAINKNMKTVCLTGNTGGKLSNICDYTIKVPVNDTPRIQEAHILIGHIICEIIEMEIFKNE